MKSVLGMSGKEGDRSKPTKNGTDHIIIIIITVMLEIFASFKFASSRKFREIREN